MTEKSYKAWDGKKYKWPPPEGWYRASDDLWWPEGYGPKNEPVLVEQVKEEPVIAPVEVGVNTPVMSDEDEETSSFPVFNQSAESEPIIPELSATYPEEVVLPADSQLEHTPFSDSQVEEVYVKPPEVSSVDNFSSTDVFTGASDFGSDPVETVENFQVPSVDSSFLEASLPSEVAPPQRNTSRVYPEEVKEAVPSRNGLASGGLLDHSSVSSGFRDAAHVQDREKEKYLSESGRHSPVLGVPVEKQGSSKGVSLLKVVLLGILVGLIAYGAYFLFNTYVKEKEGSLNSPHEQGWNVALGVPSEEDSSWVLQVQEPARVISQEELQLEAVGVSPATGNVYLQVPVSLTREEGAGSASPSVFDFSSVTPGNRLYALSEQCSDAVEGSFDLEAVVSPSSSVSGYLCWEVPEADAPNMLLALGVEGADNRVHVSLQ